MVKKGRLVMYTSVRRAPDYPGYERRLGIAAFVMGRNFGRRAQSLGVIEKPRLLSRRAKRRQKARKPEGFFLRVKGKQTHAVRGLVAGGFRFLRAYEVKNPSFNGCRGKKTRRR